jgi:hypothetical protein
MKALKNILLDKIKQDPVKLKRTDEIEEHEIDISDMDLDYEKTNEITKFVDDILGSAEQKDFKYEAKVDFKKKSIKIAFIKSF